MNGFKENIREYIINEQNEFKDSIIVVFFIDGCRRFGAKSCCANVLHHRSCTDGT